MSDNKFFTSKEASIMLGKAQITISYEARVNNIGSKFGRDWLFTPEEIEMLKALKGPGRRPWKHLTPSTDSKVQE